MNHAVRNVAASAVGVLALAVSALAAEADKPPVQSAGPTSFSRERTEDVCTREPRSQWLPEAEMRLLAEFRGYKIATLKSPMAVATKYTDSRVAIWSRPISTP